MEYDTPSGSSTLFADFLRHPESEYKILRQLGLSFYGASTLGECMKAAHAVSTGQAADWVQAWSQLASETEDLAEQVEKEGHRRSAAAHLLRAANYYQMAEYYAFVREGNHVHFGLKCQACFERGLKGLPFYSEVVELGVNGHRIPGYFFTPDDSGRARPTIAVIPGVESSAEEMYFYHGAAALARGYNVLLFQGPGQPGALRYDAESRLRHDSEVPLQVALDLLHDRPDVDRERIALVGGGIGSYFAMRVAAFDPRVKALVVNPPFVSLHPIITRMLGPRALIVDVDIHDLAELPPSILRADLNLLLLNMCRRFGATRLQMLLQLTEAYSVEDLLYRIHCPVLSVSGTLDQSEMLRQNTLFHERVQTEDRTHMRIPTQHEADTHYHYSNLPLLNMTVLDWLDRRFGPA